MRPWLLRTRRVLRMPSRLVTGEPEPSPPADPPTISDVSPSTGVTTGGQTITITGTGFVNGCRVFFGAAESETVTFVGSTEVQAVTPAASAGEVNVTVINPDEQSATEIDGFEYVLPAPAISSITPDTGFTTGGEGVTIAGENFVDGCTVTIGGASATSVVFVDATEVTCDTPSGSVGARDVVLTNPDTQADTLEGGFTYETPPFDPASLTLSLFLEPDSLVTSGSASWSGKASAGDSANQDLTTESGSVDAGTAQNGHTPAEFTGASTDRLSNGSINIGDLYTASAYGGCIVLRIPSGGATTGIICGVVQATTGSGVGIAWRSNLVQLVHFTGAVTEVLRSFGDLRDDTYHALFYRFSSGTLQVRLDGGAWSGAGGVSNVGSMSSSPSLGMTNTASDCAAMRVLAWYAKQSAWTDQEADDLWGYIQNEFDI